MNRGPLDEIRTSVLNRTNYELDLRRSDMKRGELELKDIRIVIDDLTDEQVIALVTNHKKTMLDITPEESVHALDVDDLKAESITFWTLWSGQNLMGCGALSDIGDSQGEIKSMRTHENFLRQGVAQSILEHIISEAKKRSYTRLYLETGVSEEFYPAHKLYKKSGFIDCGPFVGYELDDNSRFMYKDL